MKKISGVVQEGNARGRELGYPTINLPLQREVDTGVYAGLVHQGDVSHQAAVFADQERDIIEAHILDFEADLYGQTVQIELRERIRDTKKFATDDELKKAIDADITKIRNYFNT